MILVEHAPEIDALTDRDESLGEDAARQRAFIDPLDVATGPKRLNNYVLLDHLGYGGMGVVYVAYDEQLDRKVAIKLLRPSATALIQQRLIREAQAMARLSHPNVVQIYEIGEHEGRPYVVMEFVEGLTLRGWLQSTRRPRREILSVFISAGRGLAAAHAKGLVHRDFKPDNVMIEHEGRVLVMDFGLAHGAERADHEAQAESKAEAKAERARAELSVDINRSNELSTPMTLAGSIMGTPGYMAPEQLEGRDTDARADQFAFCVALWEALYSRRPFAGGDLTELLDAIYEGKIDAPERTDVPGWIRKLLRRGLEPNPERRWPSMDALLAVLERDPTRRRRIALALASCLIVAAGAYATWFTSREHEPWPHERVRHELSTCTVLGREIEQDWNPEVRDALAERFAATGLSFAATAWTRTNAWMSGYTQDWIELRTQSCFEARVGQGRRADRAVEVSACLAERRSTFAALLDAWTEVDAQTVTLAMTAAASLAPISRCTSARFGAPGVRPPAELEARVVELRARLERVAALRLAGKFEAGLSEARAVLELARDVGWRPLEAEAEAAIGRLHDELGDYDAAEAALRRAHLAAVAGGHDQLALDAAAWLTLVVGDKLGKFEAGLQWGELGLMLIERLDLGGTIHEAELLYGIGLIQDRVGDYDEAEASLRRAYAISVEELGPAHPEVARQLNGLGGVYWSRAAYADALDTQLSSLAIVEDALGSDHPEVARSLNNIGLVLAQLGDYDEALDTQREALALREAALGPAHPDVAATLNALGASLALRGDHQQALAAHRRALAILEAALGRQHPSVARTVDEIGAALAQLGDDAAALESHRRSLTILERSFGPQHPELATALIGIAEVLGREGQRGAGRAYLERALAIREAALGPDHALVVELRARLDGD